MEGKVKFFNRIKGFGFIAGDDGKEYFVHKSALTGNIQLRDNDAVTFEPTQGERGLKAENVSLSGNKESAEEAPQPEAEQPEEEVQQPEEE